LTYRRCDSNLGEELAESDHRPEHISNFSELEQSCNRQKVVPSVSRGNDLVAAKQSLLWVFFLAEVRGHDSVGNNLNELVVISFFGTLGSYVVKSRLNY